MPAKKRACVKGKATSPQAQTSVQVEAWLALLRRLAAGALLSDASVVYARTPHNTKRPMLRPEGGAA